MKIGLVLGKYLPFTLGHASLIHFALNNCDYLNVLLCADDNEPIAGDIREGFLLDHFKDNERVNIIHKNTTNLPNSTVSDIDVSRVWSYYLKEILPEVNVIFTSEKYGDYVAEFMGIQHIQYNQNRDIVPISATMVRINPFKCWDYIPKAVRKFYQKKICICGTESTGKSIITQKLAEYYNCQYAKEVARDICCNTNECDKQTINDIVIGQANEIVNKIDDSKLFFSDTDLITTISYSKYLFNEYPDNITEEIQNINKFDIYLFLWNDVPFIQDRTRMGEPKRSELQKVLINNYKDKNIRIVKGRFDEKFEECKNIINNLYF